MLELTFKVDKNTVRFVRLDLEPLEFLIYRSRISAARLLSGDAS